MSNTIPGALVAFVLEEKTMDEAEEFFKNERIEITERDERWRVFSLEVPVGREAKWQRKILRSRLFEAVIRKKTE